MTSELENKQESLEIKNEIIGETPTEVKIIEKTSEKTENTELKTDKITESDITEKEIDVTSSENLTEIVEPTESKPEGPSELQEDNSVSPEKKTTETVETIEENSVEAAKEEPTDVEKTEEDIIVDTSNNPEVEVEKIDFSELSREEIIVHLKELIHNSDIEKSRNDIDSLKSYYYKRQKFEFEQIKKDLKEKSGDDVEIEMPKDRLEDYLKELMTDYKKKKTALIQQQEQDRQQNLILKQDVIEKIKGLANSEESLNKTFAEFKSLQKEWSNIGHVSNTEANTLWKNYQLQIERFYDLVKINNELRDLDFKKNLEKKLVLCEKAEELLLKTDTVAAYKDLQRLHETWKELGPVSSEKREEMWDRFSTSTKKIRQSYQDHFEKLKKERELNYEQKVILCEKAEAINQELNPKNGKEWSDVSNSVLELQKIWKTIGMVPKEVNTVIYERFRAACNKFFDAKKEYFDVINSDLNENYQKKLELCVNAESMQSSTDWRKTSTLFFDLQKKWKEIGPAPRKNSDQIWKRFRTACDSFFNAKSDFYKNIEKDHKDNLIKKEALIAEIDNFKPSKDQADNISKIKEYQSQWTEIGYVANAHKDRLYNEYKAKINNIYDKLNLSKSSLDISNFNSKVEVMKETGNISFLIKERSNIIRRIQDLNTEINQMENNMGFFSSGSDSIIKDFQKKIDKANGEIKVLKDKKKAIDLAEREIKKTDNKSESND